MSPRRPVLVRRAASGTATLVLGLAALSALTGCSTADSADTGATAAPTAAQPAQPTGDVSEGTALSGEGYSLTAPPGWTETTDSVRERFQQVDAAAGDTAVTGGFADNVNVIVSDKRRIKSQRKAERILASELRLVGKGVQVQEPGDLDGETAYHATARLKVGHLKVRTTQYFAKHGKAWYLVTFSYGPQTDEESEAEEIQSMLDSWTWKD